MPGDGARGLLRGLAAGVRTGSARRRLAERACRAAAAADGVRSADLALARTGTFRTTLQGELALEPDERALALLAYDAAMREIVLLLHAPELAPWGPDVGVGAIRGRLPGGEELTGRDLGPRLRGPVPLPEITAAAFAARYGLES